MLVFLSDAVLGYTSPQVPLFYVSIPTENDCKEPEMKQSFWSQRDCFTFIYVRGQSSHKDLARVAFHALSVLMREVWGAQACETLIATLIIRETILHGEERGVAWEREREQEGSR